MVTTRKRGAPASVEAAHQGVTHVAFENNQRPREGSPLHGHVSDINPNMLRGAVTDSDASPPDCGRAAKRVAIEAPPLPRTPSLPDRAPSSPSLGSSACSSTPSAATAHSPAVALPAAAQLQQDLGWMDPTDGEKVCVIPRLDIARPQRHHSVASLLCRAADPNCHFKHAAAGSSNFQATSNVHAGAGSQQGAAPVRHA